jgi:hypothetical protein
MEIKILNFLLFCFLYLSTPFQAARLRATTLTECYALKMMNKFLPYFYFHPDEKHWPSSIEAFNINWTNATFYDAKQYISFTRNEPTSLSQSTPVYTSVYLHEDNTLTITYNILFQWNGCGGDVKIKLKLSKVTIYSDSYSFCDYGSHYIDKQIVVLKVASDHSTVTKITLSHHESMDEYSKSQISWSGDHPIIYNAKGTHASYNDSETQNYKTLIDLSSDKGANEVEAYLREYTSSSGKVLKSTNPRLIKYNGTQANGLSESEINYAIKYYGRMGKDIYYDKSANKAYSILNKVAKKLDKVGLDSWAKKVRSAAQSLLDLFTGVAGKTIASNTYWKNN